MKHIVLYISATIVGLVTSCKEEKWNQAVTKKTYMLANETNAKNKNFIRLYVDEETYLLGDTNFSLMAKDLEIENGDIYVLANKTNTSNFTTECVVFKNKEIIKTLTSTSAFIPTALCVSGSDIFIAGTGQDSGSKSKLKLWKNGVITNLTTGLTSNVTCNDMIIDNGDVYIAGAETPDSSEIKVAKYWKNGSQVALGQNSEVKRIVKSNNDICCSGISNELPCYWHNGTLTLLGQNKGQCVGIFIESKQIHSLVSSQINGIFHSSIWNGQSETFLTDANSHPKGSFGTELIKNGAALVAAGGIFNNDDTVTPVIWKNGQIQLMPYTPGNIAFISKILYK